MNTVQEWEKTTRNLGLKPLHKEVTPYGSILLAEGFKNDDRDFPAGYYLVTWAIERPQSSSGSASENEIDWGGGLYIDAMHNIELPLSDRPRARRNAALREAWGWITVNFESGRYDA